MAKKVSLKAKKRKILGRAVKTLRREGILPGNVYGKGMKSQAVEVDLVDFRKVYQEAGETKLVDLEAGEGKKALPVLINNLQVHPVSGDFLHVDFHRVSLKEKVTATVPVELKGKAPVAESGEGVLITLLPELEVEALPVDLPEKLEIDISNLKKIDDSVRVKEIKIDKKKVAILAGENEMVAKIEKPTEEEEEKPVEEVAVEEEKAEGAEVEGEVAREKKPQEGQEEEVKKEEGAERKETAKEGKQGKRA